MGCYLVLQTGRAGEKYSDEYHKLAMMFSTSPVMLRPVPRMLTGSDEQIDHACVFPLLDIKLAISREQDELISGCDCYSWSPFIVML